METHNRHMRLHPPHRLCRDGRDESIHGIIHRRQEGHGTGGEGRCLNVHQQDVVSGVLHASFGRFRLNPFAPSLNENAIRLTANHQRDVLDLLVQI